MREQWLPVRRWEGVYEVSSLGRVWRVGRAKKAVPGRMLKQGRSYKGYPVVWLSEHPRKETILVHKAVLEAFAGPRPEGMQCRHLDGDKENSSLDNLRWGTAEENQYDRLVHDGGNRGRPHKGMNSYKARAVCYLVRRGKIRHRQIAHFFGVSIHTIRGIARGQGWVWATKDIRCA